MKTLHLPIKRISILFLSLFVLAACNKDDDNEGTEPDNETEQSDAKSITSFTFLAADNDALSEDFEGSINEDAKTITLVVPFGTDITALVPTITISEVATVDPENKLATNFGEAVIYTVTAEDDSEAKYTVTVSIGESSSKMVTAFVFLAADNNTLSEDVETTIDEGAKTITAEVPFGTELTALVPTIAISEAATVAPNDKQATDFSEAVTYTVTAEDNSEAKYTVTVSVAEGSDAKAITSFTFLAADNDDLTEDVQASIDETAKTISAEVPFDTELTALVPTIAISEAATVDPDNKQATDFSEAVTYTVTAEDGGEAEYTVTVTVDALMVDRAALIALYNANPGNRLDWDLEDEDISNWDGVTVEGGRVTNLQLNTKDLPNLPSEIGNLTGLIQLNIGNNDIKEIPAEIGNLSNLTSLSLGRNYLQVLPGDIGNLTSLLNLELHSNFLKEIPAEIGNLTELKSLYLLTNNLTELPSEIGNLTNLNVLNMSDNRITSIPKEISNLTNLTILDISDNRITSIPKEICDLDIETFRKDGTAICEE